MSPTLKRPARERQVKLPQPGVPSTFGNLHPSSGHVNIHDYTFGNVAPYLPVPKKPPDIPVSGSNLYSVSEHQRTALSRSERYSKSRQWNRDFGYQYSTSPSQSAMSYDTQSTTTSPFASIPACFISTPMSDPTWDMSRMLMQLNPSVFLASDSSDAFKIIWDTGASEVITSDPSDFVTPYSKPTTPLRLRGVSSGTMVEGVGVVEYCLRADDGTIITVRMKAYFMPGSLPLSVKLVPPQRLCLLTGGEFISTGTTAILRLPHKPSITIELDPSSHLPCSLGTRSAFLLDQHQEVNLCVTEASNQNLTTAQKHLLTWHFRFGHVNFKTVQWIIRSGVFGKTPTFYAAAKCDPPKCAACEFGKARRRPIKSAIKRPVPERENALKGNVLFPGQRVSIDHFECSAKGRLSNSRGKTPIDDMYRGGAIFVDQASGYLFIQSQVTFSSTETLEAKLTFERMALGCGVTIVSYVTDNGAFSAKEFSNDIAQRGQQAKYSGVGAHHHNGIAERAIQTTSNMARTMMLHAAIRWPDMTDSSLWPLAMEYAAYIYNHVPNIESGVAPIDTFTRSTVPRQRLRDLHVWGCPVYVLEPKLQDGKKIPRWLPRSRRGVFLGLSPVYASTVPLVLNPVTLNISPQFHVVFDDLFSTVVSQSESDEPPLDWEDLCISSRYETIFDDNDPIRLSDEWLTSEELDLRRHQDSQNRVVLPPIAFDPIPATPLQPLDPPIIDPIFPSLLQQGIQPQREQPSQQREPTTSVMSPSPKPKPSPPVVPSPTIQDSSVKRSSRLRTRPIKFNDFDVKYGSLSTVDAFFATLPDILRDPIAQKEYELNNLESAINLSKSLGESFSLSAFAASKSDPDTLMYHEAMMASDKELFQEAMDVEIAGLESQNTWTVVPRSSATSNGKKVLPGTWTFKRKRYPDGRIKKYKARFCVRGDKQVVGVDVFETYAPVVQWSSVRLCFILSVILDLSSRQVDYTNAFVQANVKTPMFVELPKGYNSKVDGDCVLKLNKNLYGSRDAPLAWFETLTASLVAEGFKPSDIDPCLFIHKDMLILCFVDDLIYLGQDITLIDAMIAKLGASFTLTVEEDLSSFLGIQIEHLADRSMKLTQSGLTTRILDTCLMSDCNSKDTPALSTAVGSDLSGSPFTHDFSYPSAIGMLMYLSSNSRPDIAFAVHQCARFTHSPKASHGEALRRICRYLKGTSTQGLILRPTAELRLDVHVDSDFAGLWKREDDQDPVCVKSRTGFVISLAGCPLMWQSKLQGQVALSTMEAEYIALSTSLRSLIPLKSLVHEVASSLMDDATFITTTYSSVFEDNNGALILATVPRMTPRSKHIAVPYHFFREHVTKGTIKIFKVESSVNTADLFTKGLDRVKFQALRLLLMGW